MTSDLITKVENVRSDAAVFGFTDADIDAVLAALRGTVTEAPTGAPAELRKYTVDVPFSGVAKIVIQATSQAAAIAKVRDDVTDLARATGQTVNISGRVDRVNLNGALTANEGAPDESTTVEGPDGFDEPENESDIIGAEGYTAA